MSNEKSSLTALLPCPFCGGEPVLTVVHENDDGIGEVEFAYVRCPTCGTQRGERPSEFTARQAWNRRTDSHATLKARIEELEAALREISNLYVNAPGWAAPEPSHQREYQMHQIARAALQPQRAQP